MGIETEILQQAVAAKEGARILASADAQAKTDCLETLADMLADKAEAIYAANAKDLAAAEENGLDAPKVDRLRITPGVLDSMVAACRHVAALSDPVGEIETSWKRPNGLLVGKMRIPLGVIAMIYESRPNVTIDASILCLKAGNGVLLRGGSEAIHSNRCLAAIMQDALRAAKLPARAVQLVQTTDRAAVPAMCKLDEYIDVIIPRGGAGLIRAVVAEATMPVLKHYEGICHIFVDAAVDEDQAVEIVHNSKVQRPGVCNALECLLVHRARAQSFLPKIAERLGADKVVFKACPESLPLLGETAQPATDADFGKEFHDYILAVKVVDDMDAALDHIDRYSSDHTDVILTREYKNAMDFIRRADSSMAGVNCSTRFNDGGELGLGAEIGISTSKLHSFGPMGVKELTSTKFVVFGEGQVRQ